MYSPEVYLRIVQNLQYLSEQHYLTPTAADQILMSIYNSMGSVSSIMNQYCANYGMWINGNMIPQKPTTFNNYGSPNGLHFSKADIKYTVETYLRSKGLEVVETKLLSTTMMKHACPYAGVVHLEPYFLVINQLTSYRYVLYYYCNACKTAYILDDTMTPIGVSIPYESIFRKQITVQNVNIDYARMELIANQRMFFSRNVEKFYDNTSTIQMIEPSLYNMQVRGMCTPIQAEEIKRLLFYGNSVKKVFDTYFADYVDTINGHYFPYRRTRFDNEGNPIETHYTYAEKVIGIANYIEATTGNKVKSVMRVGELTPKHACFVKGVVPTQKIDIKIFDGMSFETPTIYFCKDCGKLLYVDGESQSDTIDDSPMIVN